ncbi:hypothetical protein Hanom_Chr02g00109881 [Helianthus anomalus]
MTQVHFWTKMAIKLKPQGSRCKKFKFWNKVSKVTKPQGPKWQFTLIINIIRNWNIILVLVVLTSVNFHSYYKISTLKSL